MFDLKLSFRTALLLTVPPLMWASNAVIGRLVQASMPPMTLNFVRWTIAMLILLPMAKSILHPRSGLWANWKSFAVLGLLGVGLYNSLLYLALHSSSPINVTLVAASVPFWTMLIGKWFFNAKAGWHRVIGGILSLCGVLVVLSRGETQVLAALHWVPGDLYMIAASIAWAFYSWLLTRQDEPKGIRENWSAFLLAQIVFGVLWSGALTTGEWLLGDPHITWSRGLVAALLFIAIGPAVIAFRCWGQGVQEAGPTTAGLFTNLTPLFAAVLSSAFLGETPRFYHLVAFIMIVAGIVLSARTPRAGQVSRVND